MKLRPLIVVTGALRAEGGRKSHQEMTRKGDVMHIEEQRSISSDRRHATTLSTSYMRRLKRLRILMTPFGHIIDREKLPEVRRLLSRAANEVGTFHATPRDCKLTNCMIWEPLQGNRLMAFTAWLMANRNTPEVKAVLPDLRLIPAATDADAAAEEDRAPLPSSS